MTGSRVNYITLCITSLGLTYLIIETLHLLTPFIPFPLLAPHLTPATGNHKSDHWRWFFKPRTYGWGNWVRPQQLRVIQGYSKTHRPDEHFISCFDLTQQLPLRATRYRLGDIYSLHWELKSWTHLTLGFKTTLVRDVQDDHLKRRCDTKSSLGQLSLPSFLILKIHPTPKIKKSLCVAPAFLICIVCRFPLACSWQL